MTKAEQTKEVLIKLYDLTLSYTKYYQPHYYYQYRGDVHDLALEYYCEFLTPKARVGVKETLLDKFNPEITSLAYLVKVAVTRKLIDSSRGDTARLVSIDQLMTDYGDVITDAFNLTTEMEQQTLDELLEESEVFKTRVKSAFSQLEEFVRNTIFAKLYNLASPLCQVLEPTFRYIKNCPIHQITDKTVVLYIPDYHQCLNFALDDGHPRGNRKPFCIDTEGLTQYHSGFDRDLFEQYLNEKYVPVL